MADKVLRKHCEISWELAVHNLKLIIDGLVDIVQQKVFISSLQNAIELCFKQILIDENSYDVLEFSKMGIDDARDYLNATNINDYIDGLEKTKKSKLYSAEFNDLVRIFIGKIKTDSGRDFSNEFGILKDLRNNETHFYIDVDDYLSFNQFIKICELVDYLYEYFKDKDVIKHIAFGKPASDWETDLSYFKMSDYTFKSYQYFIKEGNTNKQILSNLNRFNPTDKYEGTHIQLRDPNDKYGIAYELFNLRDNGIEGDGIEYNLRMNFNEFYRRFSILMDSGKIICTEIIEEPELEVCDGNDYVLKGGYFALVVTKK